MQPFRIRGIPIFVHWSVLFIDVCIAANAYLVNSFVSSSADWRVAIGCCFSYTVSITAHEFGHAAAATSVGLKVHAIHLTGGASHCRTDRPHSVRSAFLLYSGGLLAHLALLSGAASYLALFGWPRSPAGLCAMYTFVAVNLISIAITLVPYRWGRHVSDGRILWRLLMHAIRDVSGPLPVPESNSQVSPTRK